MPIVVCDSAMKVWYEKKPDMGADWDLIELILYLRDNWPRENADNRAHTTPVMLVCHNPHKVFQYVHSVLKDDPEWNARFSVNTGDKFYMSDGAAKEPKVRTARDIRIALFGFRTPDRKTKYFHPITPLDFMDDFKTFGDIDWPEYIRLYQWGGSVRKWMQKNKLRFSATRGGLASQLLRDKRFYPENRRKVPRETNEKARKALPGNFYAMSERYIEQLTPAVYLIDQENAHHHAASTVLLPDANTLFARGRFLTESDKPFAREKRTTYTDLLNEHGLLRCRVYIPKNHSNIATPWSYTNGLADIYIYTNELDLIKEMGIEIRHISYAWTSRDVDAGLSKYSRWAQIQVEKAPLQKPWLKPTLLSVYGILGVRPRKMEMAYYRSEAGEDFTYILGATPITMKRIVTQKAIQSPIANVIHRGMVEAHTRKLSIQLARKLDGEGHTIVAIHADAVLVKDEGQQLPLLPPPWRVKDRLTQFKAMDRVSFHSDQVTIMPGRRRSNAKTKR